MWKIVCYIAVLLILWTENQGHAGVGHWAMRGPNGQQVFTVAVDPVNPKVLYAGSFRGMFKSTDAGASWTLLTTGLPEIAMVHHLSINPHNPLEIYACTGSEFGGGQVLKSTDGGATWSLILKSSGSQVLALDPTNPRLLYVGVYEVGFLKSRDGGSSWTMIGVQPGVTAWRIQVSDLKIDPKNSMILYAGAIDGTALQSVDAGVNWTNVLTTGDNGPVDDLRDFRIYSVNVIVVVPTQPTTLYVGTEGRGVLKSIDGGATWKEMNCGIDRFVHAVAINPRAPIVLYAASYDDVFMSTDGGEHWKSLQFRSSTPGVNAITVNP
jgi:photosystem II stability/assembly factor-like uncharacterized protein